MTEPTLAQTLVDRAARMDVDRLNCGGCSRGADADQVPAVTRLLNHMINDHGSVPPLFSDEQSLFTHEYVLREALNLPARSDKEKQWRADPKAKAAIILERMVAETQRHNTMLAELSRELEELEKKQ